MADVAEPRLLRIQEAAAEIGITPRTVRYYEEVGLLKPAARSDGDYRLFDADDLERLQAIRALRDDAGFSLAEIAGLLEDQEARVADRQRLRSSHDPEEQRVVLLRARDRVVRQLALLRPKHDRLASMIVDAEARRARIEGRLSALDTPEPDASAEVPASA